MKTRSFAVLVNLVLLAALVLSACAPAATEAPAAEAPVAEAPVAEAPAAEPPVEEGPLPAVIDYPDQIAGGKPVEITVVQKPADSQPDAVAAWEEQVKR